MLKLVKIALFMDVSYLFPLSVSYMWKIVLIWRFNHHISFPGWAKGESNIKIKSWVIAPNWDFVPRYMICKSNASAQLPELRFHFVCSYEKLGTLISENRCVVHSQLFLNWTSSPSWFIEYWIFPNENKLETSQQNRSKRPLVIL